MPHETRDVGRLTDGRISHHVKIGEAGDAQRFADSVTSGVLHIAEQLARAGEPQPGEQGEHARRGVLRFR